MEAPGGGAENATLGWTSEQMRDFLEKFYASINPEKLTTVDLILERYRGHEGELFEHLKEKYDVAGFVASSGIELPAGVSAHNEDESEEDDESDEEDEDEDDDEEGSSEEDPKDGRPSYHDKQQQQQQRNGSVNRPKQMSDSSNSSGSGSVDGSPVDDAGLRHPQPSTSASMVQDLSNRLLGWQKATGISPAPKQATTKPRAGGASPMPSPAPAYAPAQTPPSAQRDSERTHMMSAITSLKTQVTSLKKDNEIAQRNLVSIVDRENTAVRENNSLREQLRAAERSHAEVTSRLQFMQLLRDNKHTQLVETIQINLRLGSQVRYLACKAFETMENPGGGVGSGGTGQANKRGGELRLPEFSELEKKIVQAAADAAGKSATTRGGDRGATAAPDPTTGVEKIATATSASEDEDSEYENDESLVAALRVSLEVMHSSLLASRVELRLAIKQNAACEMRVAEQQLTIEDLQDRLATIERDMQTASGSADHLKRQVQETGADLTSHKLMLAMAERNLAERTEELSEAREKVDSLQDSLSASAAARSDLAALCAANTADAEQRAAEHMRSLTERLLCEREELLSRLATVCFIGVNFVLRFILSLAFPNLTLTRAQKSSPDFVIRERGACVQFNRHAD